jgi:hypothetical protein
LGNTATFSVTATGNLPLTYAWQFLSGATWHNFTIGTGFNTATFTFPAATAFANGEQIRVVVTDGNGLSTTSNAVTLTVSDAAPVITVQPTNQTVTHPAAATFSVTATGNLPLTYAWQYSANGGVTWITWVAGPGYNTATFTTPATNTTFNGYLIHVIVTDGNALSTTSATATLTVN